jgi:prevent-host-death family protein
VADATTNQVTVRDLKTHLSAWLSRARAGEVVEVTSHRQPIARITAITPAPAALTSPLQNAIDAGVVSWSGAKPLFPKPVTLKGTGQLVSTLILNDRN